MSLCIAVDIENISQDARTTTHFSAVLFNLDFYHTFVSNTNIVFIRTLIFLRLLKREWLSLVVRKEQ